MAIGYVGFSTLACLLCAVVVPLTPAQDQFLNGIPSLINEQEPLTDTDEHSVTKGRHPATFTFGSEPTGTAATRPDHAAADAVADDLRPPIIDMHLHAYPLDEGKPAEVNPATGQPSAARTSAELRDMSLAALKRYNIVKAVASGPPETVDQWREVAPDRIIPGAFVYGAYPLPDIAQLRVDIQAGRVQVLGELVLQHLGIAPNDPCMEPYYALAEEMDIPVGIHTGIGPPGTPYDPCCPHFRVTLGNPILLEEVLIRHPRLRIYLMHGGAPYLQETKAIMSVYPQVYADLATINWIIPREEFHSYLRELIIAGFGKRLLFGSDQMEWPEAIGMAVEGIESATFLTEEEKRNIFYNNAVRFLRLDGK